MKNFTVLLIIALSLQAVSSFQLQGTWTLTQIQQFPTIYESVAMQITDSVYRSTSIVQNMTFSGCQSYKYLSEFIQNNIFIKYSSFQYETVSSQQAGNSSVKCTDNSAKMHSIIRSELLKVFYFQLAGNYLVLLNPNKDILFKFQRVQSTKVRNLRGIWNLYSLKSTQVSQKVEIADNQITLCKGKLIVGYTLSDKYGFKTRLISNDGCDVQDLEKAVLSSAFSRKIGNSLEIYNSGLDLIMLMSYVEDIDLASAQQARQKAILEAKANEETSAKIQAQSQAKAKAEAQALAKFQAQSVTTSLVLTNTKDDLLGLWQPVTILSMPMSGSSIYFILSSNLISYNGGCNTFQFQYSAVESSKSIQIGQNKTTSNTCEANDDGLYVNGFARIGKYAVSIVGKEFRLKLTDGGGNVVYEFRKTVQVAAAGSSSSASGGSSSSVSTTSSASSTTTSTTTTSTPTKTPSIVIPGLQSGKYVFLVLARRDLPRKFCTITDSKITYTGCNSIEHTYKVPAQGQIKITGGPTSTKTCSTNNDETLSNAFNSITSFTAGTQTGSYVLKNAKNEDIINLSLF